MSTFHRWPSDHRGGGSGESHRSATTAALLVTPKELVGQGHRWRQGRGGVGELRSLSVPPTAARTEQAATQKLLDHVVPSFPPPPKSRTISHAKLYQTSRKKKRLLQSPKRAPTHNTRSAVLRAQTLRVKSSGESALPKGSHDTSARLPGRPGARLSLRHVDCSILAGDVPAADVRKDS